MSNNLFPTDNVSLINVASTLVVVQVGVGYIHTCMEASGHYIEHLLQLKRSAVT